MKCLYYLKSMWLVFMFSPILLFSNPTNDSVVVYVFLLEKCVVCSSSVPALKDIYSSFHDQGVEFIGIFPNSNYSTQETIDSFSNVHQLPFPLKLDNTGVWTQQLNATVTPEVIVARRSSGVILYRGKIDNLYERVGKRRQVVTEFYLIDALESILSNRDIAIKETLPVGCFIMK